VLMDQSARLFICARCHNQVMICRDCDRGHIYCASSCAKKARQLSLRAAGARYQQTRRGKFNHAQRQKRYRTRFMQKMTHQTSKTPSNHAVISLQPREQVTQGAAPKIGNIYCHFCRQCCNPYVRMHFLRYPPRGQQVWRLPEQDP